MYQLIQIYPKHLEGELKVAYHRFLFSLDLFSFTKVSAYNLLKLSSVKWRGERQKDVQKMNTIELSDLRYDFRGGIHKGHLFTTI